MTISYSMASADLPEELAELQELALDLRWSWCHAADELWQRIDPELWSTTRNPWLILQVVSRKYLLRLAADPDFTDLLRKLRREQCAAHQRPAWFQQTRPKTDLSAIAYFSMEFGLDESLPIYSGGLGVLAADYLKASSELGIPVIGIGLLYQQGYFRQGLDAQGNQLAFFPYNDPTELPIRPVRNHEGEWLFVEVELPGRILRLRIWQVVVGRVVLYLLDSNDPLNSPADRGITSELYGGNDEMRLQQEIVLGIGGYRVLQALRITPEICHLNEGHAALVVLERARFFMIQHQVPFDVALTATRAGNLFTTHTPVEAGFDRFVPWLFEQYLGEYAADLGIRFNDLLAMGRTGTRGRDSEEPFHMAWLAMHGCGAVNGVSQLHGRVSRGIFQPLFQRWPTGEVPVGHVTNGVHVPSWDSRESDRLWTGTCGKERWRGDLQDLETAIMEVPEARLWEMRTRNRLGMITWLRRRLARQQDLHGPALPRPPAVETIFDPNVLTLGFARRFTSYKRPDLLLHEPRRLARLLVDSDRPVQLVLAGKAHPQDHEGQAMIHAWIGFIREFNLEQRVVFLVDHDLLVAEHLVQGVDLWINTPRRPWEACGTSGMKVLVNGGLNVSELDGWWAEAWNPEVGWSLGDGGLHDNDPAWDAKEAHDLYALLENEIIPAFYQRNARGIPKRWVQLMRHSMAGLTPRFSANRMVREYTEKYYLEMAAAVNLRTTDATIAREINLWKTSLEQHWSRIHFGRLESRTVDKDTTFTIQVYLDDLDPEAVQVELYADSQGEDGAEIYPMTKVKPLTGAVHGYMYTHTVRGQRPATDYTVRVVPFHPDAKVPLEANQILWER
ncbi:MAG: alpha-glucan family phosphorylase [Desulfobacterales bacterium]|nr:alpha-glucan family phosphorylase [Desulfobacterales bacterium]